MDSERAPFLKAILAAPGDSLPRKVYADWLAERGETLTVEKYRPSNGTEGSIFEGRWCERCGINRICQIMNRAFMHDIDEPEYPKQWIRVDGVPLCTSFTDPEKCRRSRMRKPAKGQISLF